MGGPDSAGPSRMDHDRERSLVDRARSDAAAFGALYDFYLPRIYGFVYRRVGDRDVTEDLTATVFQRALEAVRRAEFRNQAFGAWLYRVAANLATDHFRRGRRLVSLDWTDADGSSLAPGLTAHDRAFDALGAAVEHDELRAALATLPGTHRRVLTLRFFDDLDAEEASAVLGCSRATFTVKLHRALAALRSAMAVMPVRLTRETIDAA